MVPTDLGYCMRSAFASLPNCMTVTTGTGSNSVVPFFACKCAEKTIGPGPWAGTVRNSCASIDSATPAVGTSGVAQVLGVAKGGTGGSCNDVDAQTACGGGGTGWCTTTVSTVAAGTTPISSGDVAAVATDRCIAPAITL